MTSAQERMVNRIRKDALWMDGVEIKKFEVNETEHFVSVIVEVGRPNDEGTLAAVLCRESAQIFIGKRGAAKFPVHKKMKNGKYKHYEKPYKTFFSTSYDQRRTI